jgi:hypothetical protein
MNNLSRVCGKPNWHAESTCHSASYPHEARFPRTLSSPRTRSAATFSTSTNRGCSSQMIRKYSDQRPERAPVIPSCLPALEMSWQGNPPQMRSTSERLCRPTSRTSRNRGTSGQCLARTLVAYSLISTCHEHFIPARSSPKSIPPIPANREPNVICAGIYAHLLRKSYPTYSRAAPVIKHPLDSRGGMMVKQPRLPFLRPLQVRRERHR